LASETKFKKTEIGMIPEDWKILTLENAMESIIDYRGKTPKKTDSGIPLITAKIVKNGRILEPNEFISPQDYESWMRRGLPKPGDVVITTEAPMGEVAQLDERKVALAQRLITLRGKKGMLHNNFLRFVLQSPNVENELKKRESGTTVTGIKQKELRKALLPIPPYDEQIKLSEILISLDNKIDLNHQMNSTLEQIAQTLFKHWFIDLEFPDENGNPYRSSGGRMVDSELGEIPEGWEVKKVDETLELAYGKALKEEIRVPGNIPVYGSNGQVGWHNEKLVDGPGIVVGRKGNPGTVTFVHTDFYPIDTTFYVVPKGPVKSFYYLLYALKKQDLPSLAADSAVPGLNRNMVYMNKIIIPQRDTLSLFDLHLNNLYQKIQMNEEQSTVLASIRDSLLPKLMSGKIRVEC